MKKNYLLYFIYFIFSSILFAQEFSSVKKISLENIDSDSNIELIKSLKNNDILITYTTKEGNVFYRCIDNSENIKWEYDAPDGCSGQFYVHNNIFFKNLDNDCIVEVEPETGKLISTKKAKYLFWPGFDDADKKGNLKKIWSYQAYPKDILVINRYYNDFSFKYTNIQIVSKGINRIYGATEYLDSKGAFLLSIDTIKSKVEIFHYIINSKKTKLLFSFPTMIENAELGNISLSPDKKKLIITICNNNDTEVFYYDVISGIYVSRVLKDKDLLCVDWSFNSDYFLLVNTFDKLLYKICF